MKKILKVIAIINYSLLIITSAHAQFTKQDTLRGSNGPGRDWWNVKAYTINITPDYTNNAIKGSVSILFGVFKTGKNKVMQIDLQEPLKIDRIEASAEIKKYWREGNVYFIDFGDKDFKRTLENSNASTINTITIYYHGQPTVAKRPPWDGGWIFIKDAKGRPWMSVACQGLGASVWYPCKDYQPDEPDLGASLIINVPDSLIAVANGVLLEKKSKNGMASWRWNVKNPINNYNIIPYIGKYVNWRETYEGEKGKLECNYWVLDYNLEKAKEQFKQAAQTLKAFEHWFGPYPFYEDGFKLVEAPHLGMEHQSAVAYGNGFQNGYRGRDLSGSGWGLKWDFIIVHEVGHEWFGNNITTKDIADMWVHEGFTNYSETLFTEYYYGKEAGSDYCIGTRTLIQNDEPIIGPYGVNKEGSGDMYYKGGNMLHTIRQVINDDEKFRSLLRGMNSTFYHKIVTTQDVENYMSRQSGKDLSKIFDQYLTTTMIPVLEYRFTGDYMYYRWTNCVTGFNMPVKPDKADDWLKPTTDWQTVSVTADILKDGLKIDRNFYITVKKVE
ncbi:MAG TPA: M1 family metallopeptidase [Chitinophagaceae bacterium]|nr:M1 family metallopeptidase [Chitinophagaceae bacterium]